MWLSYIWCIQSHVLSGKLISTLALGKNSILCKTSTHLLPVIIVLIWVFVYCIYNNWGFFFTFPSFQAHFHVSPSVSKKREYTIWKKLTHHIYLKRSRKYGFNTKVTVAQNLIFLAMVLINSTQRHFSEEGYVQKWRCCCQLLWKTFAG